MYILYVNLQFRDTTYSKKARWQKTYWSGIWIEKARIARIQSTKRHLRMKKARIQSTKRHLRMRKARIQSTNKWHLRMKKTVEMKNKYVLTGFLTCNVQLKPIFMNEWMNGWINRWINELMDEWMDKLINKWMPSFNWSP